MLGECLAETVLQPDHCSAVAAQAVQRSAHTADMDKCIVPVPAVAVVVVVVGPAPAQVAAVLLVAGSWRQPPGTIVPMLPSWPVAALAGLAVAFVERRLLGSRTVQLLPVAVVVVRE